MTALPKQPSREDGLGAMRTEHWRAHVKGLRAARKAATTTDQDATADGTEGAGAA
jgi:hypothetical protein